MKSIVIIILSLIFTKCYCQTLDKNYIDNCLKTCDTTFKVQKNAQYIINGISYDGKDTTILNAQLCRLPISHLLSVDRLKPGTKAGYFYVEQETIVVTTYGGQTKKWRKILLRKAKAMFGDSTFSQSRNIYHDSKDPILFIDSKQINYTEAKNLIQKLRLKDVHDILIINSSSPKLDLQENTKNGLVRVWTSK